MAGAKHFRELECWQLARELKLKLYDLADSEEVKKDFRFRAELRDARGSLMECQDHLQDAVDRSYLTPQDFTVLTALAKRACGAVAGLQRHLRRGRRDGSR